MEPEKDPEPVNKESPRKSRGQRRATRSSPRLAHRASLLAESKDEDIPPKKLKVEEQRTEEADVLQHKAVPRRSSSPKIRSRVPIRGLRTSDLVDSEGQFSGEMVAGNDSSPIYQIKWINHKGKATPVVTQNTNGPCPLLSVINILFLQGKLKLDSEVQEITEDELISVLNMALMKTLPRAIGGDPDHAQNVRDAMSLLPDIKSGLNINVIFSGVRSFEFTRECLIFDALRIPLYHGWVYDPQSEEIVSAVGNMSYNQLVESIIRNKHSENPDTVAQALIAESFLESTASQLTVHGLFELNSALSNGDLGVFFRNNHFNVIYKHEEILCQLVTDQGYLDEPEVVWETLSTVNGDEVFLDSSFSHKRGCQRRVLDAAEEQQISQDFLMALSLQDEQNKQQDKEFGWDAYGNALGAIGMTSDEDNTTQLLAQDQQTADSQSPSVGEQSVPETVPTTSQTSPSLTTPQEEQPKDWQCIVS